MKATTIHSILLSLGMLIIIKNGSATLEERQPKKSFLSSCHRHALMLWNESLKEILSSKEHLAALVAGCAISIITQLNTKASYRAKTYSALKTGLTFYFGFTIYKIGNYTA